MTALPAEILEERSAVLYILLIGKPVTNENITRRETNIYLNNLTKYTAYENELGISCEVQ
jgi:hypothetical protein